MNCRHLVAAAAAAFLLAGCGERPPVGAAASAAAVQGVTDTEVMIGSLQDLSGPLTSWGVPVRNGL